MTRAMFALVCLALLAPVACAPDNALGPTVGTTLPQVGEPCHRGGSGPNYIARASCRRCLNDALECVGEHWACISPSIETCIPIPPPPEASADAATDANRDVSNDVPRDASSDTSTDALTDASSDAPRDTSAEASTDVATDVNRDVPNDAPRDASSDTSTDAAADAGDAGPPRPGDTCTNGIGACIRYGVLSRVANGALVCTSDPVGWPSQEVCNYIDDDCDGFIDEGCSCMIGRQYPCYEGNQATQSRGICRAGYRVCAPSGMAFGPCMNQVLPNPRGEICANGYDDDCDGTTDEHTAGGNDCVTIVP